MKAIILAGGMGTRLREVVRDVPKPMASVGGKPFLEYLLRQLKRWGIKDVILSVGYGKEIVSAYFGTGDPFGMNIDYSEEDEPLGTGGALKKAILRGDDPLYLVMNGDSYFNINFLDLMTYHDSKPSMTTMSLAFVKDMGRYGSVEIGDDGSIENFKKEGFSGPGFINGGIYLIDRDIIKLIPDGHISLEGHVLPIVRDEKRLFGKAFDTFFLDMGLPADYFWIDSNPEYLL